MPDTSNSAHQDLPSASGSVETPSDKELIPVYWLQADNDGVYLHREYARAKASGDPVTDAISYMLNDKPAKDGWFTYLKPSTDIGVSISSENVITLDLPKKVFGAHLDEGLAQRSIQQLVFTATAAAANAGVLNGSQPPKLRLLVDGAANATVFDDYRLESEYERNSSFMAPIWIIDPQNSSQFAAGKVKLNARSVAFSDGLYYRVERKNTAGDWQPVDEAQRVKATELDEDGALSRELALSPGEYRVTLWGQNNGSGAKIARTTSMFNVS